MRLSSTNSAPDAILGVANLAAGPWVKLVQKLSLGPPVFLVPRGAVGKGDVDFAPGVGVVESPGVADRLDYMADQRIVDMVHQDAAHAEIQARATAVRNRKSGEQPRPL